MNRKILIIFALIFLVATVATTAGAAKILYIGDSHTAGPFGRELTSLLESAGSEVDTYGCVGARASDYIKGTKTCDRGSTFKNKQKDYTISKIDDLLKDSNPDIVVIALGANHIGSPQDGKDLAAKVQGKTCYWIGPPQAPNYDEAKLDTFNKGVKAVIGSCTFIDSKATTEFKFCGDQVSGCTANPHFDAHGAEGTKVAKAWAKNSFDSITTASVPGAAVSTGGFPMCDGGDITRLASHGSFGRCYDHIELFEKYRQSSGLADKGVDMLLLFKMAMGESGCFTTEEMLAKGKDTAHGGIFQVDSPCLKNKACIDVEDQVREGTKEMNDKLENVLSKGVAGEDAMLLFMLAYNRGTGAVNRVIDNMQNKNMGIIEAADESCAHYFGHPGSPANGKCGIIKPPPALCDPVHCKGGYRCHYQFYCGKDSRKPKGDDFGELYAVHYATPRYNDYVSLCKSIGGTVVNKQGTAVTPTGPESTLPSSFLYGINKSILPTYSVIPSFTLTIPSVLGLMEDAIKTIKEMDKCASDIDCIENEVKENILRDSSVKWLGKYAGNIIPNMPSAGEELTSLWINNCEGPEEYLVNSFAESIHEIKGSVNDDCTVSLNLFGGLETDDDVLETFGYDDPEVTLDISGADTTIITEDSPSVKVKGIKLQLDDGSIARINDYKIDIEGLDTSKEILFYKKDESNIILVASGQESKYSNKSACNSSDKTVKFCVFDPELSLWSFDKINKMMINKSPSLKFAYEFKKRMTDVSDFKVATASYSSETVMLSWKRTSVVDVDKYVIFFSKDSKSFVGAQSAKFFSDMTISAGVQQRSVDVKTIPENNKFSSIDFDFIPDCVWDDEDLGYCSPQYRATDMSGNDTTVVLTPGDVYYDASKDSYIYLLQGVPNKVDVNYAIMGVSGDERSPDLEPPTEKGFAVDALPPVPPADLTAKRTADGGLQLEWNPSDVKSIDSSLATDIDFYEIFCVGTEDIVYDGSLGNPVKEVSTDPGYVDAELFNLYCTAQSKILLIPVDKSGNRFEWKTHAVSIN